MMNLHRVVDQEEITLLYPTVKPMIEEALLHSNVSTSAHSLYVDCLTVHPTIPYETRSSLWILEDEQNTVQGIAILDFVAYKEYGEINIKCLTSRGYMKDYLDEALQKFESFAKELGCERLVLIGRKGWESVLKRKGFDNSLCFLTKRLSKFDT